MSRQARKEGGSIFDGNAGSGFHGNQHIELKKGKSTIGREEMNQADGYIQDFLGSGALDGTPTFRAFVVGYDIAPKTAREKEIKEENILRGRVMATTYGQLTRTAHQRLFRLRERIPARYEDVSGADLSARVMQTATQAPLSLVAKSSSLPNKA